MGLRFRKSEKIAPDVRVNINEKSAGITFGSKEIYHTEATGPDKTESNITENTSASQTKSDSTESKNPDSKPWIVVTAIVLIFALFLSLNGNKQSTETNSGLISREATSETAATETIEATAAAVPLAAESDEVVYITKTGEKYHREGCRYLKSIVEISLEDALSKGFTPCGRCFK